MDKKDNKYWTQLLHHTYGHFEKDLYVLPDFLLGKPIEVITTDVTKGPGQHILIIKEEALVV